MQPYYFLRHRKKNWYDNIQLKYLVNQEIALGKSPSQRHLYSSEVP